ncbi:sec1 family domain-containing protein 2-like [Gigantopelta aegis]|uniref:sec1 family domain-containing protein 2-like n=1 Tax=Gigantopelta aegis TaxID=1735272 RepID=UPI001B88D822|nr:sec1 family domain-containing protein 2-like [Gigantopelta aegis]
MKTFEQCSDSLWKGVAQYVNHGVVFSDDHCAEVLHWHGGLTQLLQAGADDVREFSSFECGKNDQKKGVFLVSSLLCDVTAQVIKDIVQQSSFQYVVVLTSVNQAVHLFEKTGSAEGEDKSLFEKFEDRLLEWMGNMNYTAEVFYIPFFTVNVCPQFFLTPPYSELFPLLKTDVKRVELQYNSMRHGKTERKTFEDISEIECAHLPKPLQLSFKMFASSMDGLMTELDVREDVYCVGPTSRLLAMEIENFPPAKTRRKNAPNRASLVLIDRTLDLVGCTSYQFETLLDKITSVLPVLPGHHNDVLVDMTPLCSVDSNSSPDVIVPGSLSGSISNGELPNLQSLATAKQKEALMDVNRHLVEAASLQKLPLKLTGRVGRVTADQLDNTLALFKGNYQAIQAHLDTIQIAKATSQALKHPECLRHENLVSVEKNLVQVVGDESDPRAGGLAFLLKLMTAEFSKPHQDRLYTLDDFLCLLTYLYSLSGGRVADGDEELQIQKLLVDFIIKDKETLSPVIKSIVGETVSEGIVMTLVEDMWSKLEAVGSARNNLKQFREIVDPGGALSPPSNKPLLKQIVEAILDPSKPELSDIEYKSSGFKDLLKSGFGLFMSVSKPRPSDHPLLILYVVGGITSTEVKQIRDVINKTKPSTQVVIGSTRLLRPTNVLQGVFCQDNINPVAY